MIKLLLLKYINRRKNQYLKLSEQLDDMLSNSDNELHRAGVMDLQNDVNVKLSDIEKFIRLIKGGVLK